jgi:predicted N-acyltransferase
MISTLVLPDVATIVDSVADVGQEYWDSLSRNSFYSSHRWLRFCERDPSARLRYLVVLRDGRPRAAVPIHEVWREPNTVYRWRQLLADAGVRVPTGDGVVVGTRRGYQSHFLSDASDHDGYVRDVSVLLDAAKDVAARNNTPTVAALYLTTADVQAITATRPGMYPLHLGDDAWLELPGTGFEDYLDGLPRTRRRNVRHECRRFLAQDYRVTHTTLHRCLDEASRLTALTEARHGKPTDVAAIRDSFAVQAEVMGDRAEVLLLDHGGDAVGFCLFYLHRGVLVLRTVGFDYQCLSDAYEYFNLAYYIPIRHAYERGARSVHAGVAAARAKALRGATLRPLWLAVLGTRFDAGDIARMREHNRGKLHALVRELDGVSDAVVYADWEPFVPTGTPHRTGV